MRVQDDDTWERKIWDYGAKAHSDIPRLCWTLKNNEAEEVRNTAQMVLSEIESGA